VIFNHQHSKKPLTVFDENWPIVLHTHPEFPGTSLGSVLCFDSRKIGWHCSVIWWHVCMLMCAGLTSESEQCSSWWCPLASIWQHLKLWWLSGV